MLVALLLLACAPGSKPAANSNNISGDDSGTVTADSSLDASADSAPGPSDTAAAASVHLLTPTDGATVANPVTFDFSAANVASVSLDADGWPLGTAAPDAGSLSYTFDGTGYARVITLTGLDGAGNAVANDTITITVAAPGVHLSVPYYYQMDNAYEPTTTCGITSAAMLLDYWHPASVTPDSLYVDYGKSYGQAPSSLAALYQGEGLHATYSLTATRADLRAQLDAGRPVIVHGYFTASGHVVVVIGYDDGGWYTNDPAGDWDEGYFNPDGEGAYYPYGGGWDDDLGTDGDIWYSAADSSPF